MIQEAASFEWGSEQEKAPPQVQLCANCPAPHYLVEQESAEHPESPCSWLTDPKGAGAGSHFYG